MKATGEQQKESQSTMSGDLPVTRLKAIFYCLFNIVVSGKYKGCMMGAVIGVRLLHWACFHVQPLHNSHQLTNCPTSAAPLSPRALPTACIVVSVWFEFKFVIISGQVRSYDLLLTAHQQS